jgi:hypothetical protein
MPQQMVHTKRGVRNVPHALQDCLLYNLILPLIRGQKERTFKGKKEDIKEFTSNHFLIMNHQY